MARRWRRRRLHVTQAAGLYIAGLAGVAYETLAVHVDRPYLLAVFAGMLGLPSFLGKDDPPDPPGGGAPANGTGPGT